MNEMKALFKKLVNDTLHDLSAVSDYGKKAEIKAMLCAAIAQAGLNISWYEEDFDDGMLNHAQEEGSTHAKDTKAPNAEPSLYDPSDIQMDWTTELVELHKEDIDYLSNANDTYGEGKMKEWLSEITSGAITELGDINPANIRAITAYIRDVAGKCA